MRSPWGHVGSRGASHACTMSTQQLADGVRSPSKSSATHDSANSSGVTIRRSTRVAISRTPCFGA
eukprot:795720-Prymnesium_polylepis.1